MTPPTIDQMLERIHAQFKRQLLIERVGALGPTFIDIQARLEKITEVGEDLAPEILAMYAAFSAFLEAGQQALTFLQLQAEVEAEQDGNV